VAVLDGGLPAWVKAKLKTVSTHATASHLGDFKASFNEKNLKSYAEILQNIDSQNFQVIDARSKGRFDGTAPEPREGMSSGHIPNSCNLPFEAVLEHGFMKSKQELEKLFTRLNITDEPIIFSCGSGLTACIILLAAEIALPNEKAVFDGSWTEWASTAHSPIAKS
jgi:thiosulfate/3-mercaptopyruvate sulfurtransferase